VVVVLVALLHHVLDLLLVFQVPLLLNFFYFVAFGDRLVVEGELDHCKEPESVMLHTAQPYLSMARVENIGSVGFAGYSIVQDHGHDNLHSFQGARLDVLSAPIEDIPMFLHPLNGFRSIRAEMAGNSSFCAIQGMFVGDLAEVLVDVEGLEGVKGLEVVDGVFHRKDPFLGLERGPIQRQGLPLKEPSEVIQQLQSKLLVRPDQVQSHKHFSYLIVDVSFEAGDGELGEACLLVELDEIDLNEFRLLPVIVNDFIVDFDRLQLDLLEASLALSEQ